MNVGILEYETPRPGTPAPHTVKSHLLSAILMKLFLFTAVILATIMATCAAADELPPVPSIGCPVIDAKDAPKIDGAIDEPIWAEAEAQARHQKMYGRGDSSKMEFRVLTDGDWLYISATAFEKGIPEGDEEYIDFVIAPDKDSDQTVYFVCRLDSKGVKKRESDKFRGTDKDWLSAFAFKPDQYTLEMAIKTTPIFGGKLTKGKAFDFNITRARITVLGDKLQLYQQWSHTGESSGARYRFGEITVGNVADQLPLLRRQLQSDLDAARASLTNPSDEVKKAFAKAEQQAEALLNRTPANGVTDADFVKYYRARVFETSRAFRRLALVDRGVILWTCNPMAVPAVRDLPPPGVKDADTLDIRVLGGEWESAAMVVTNLTPNTLNGQILLEDFVSTDGKTKLSGWDVMKIRVAAPYTLQTGETKRDPLPRLQEGGLFKVAPDDNELLWLTFKSHGVAPGKYTAKMTVRSMDDRVTRIINLVYRVYPLSLGAENKPDVHVWNHFTCGKDWAERAQMSKDYYITTGYTENWPHLPYYVADADGNLTSDKLDFTEWDRTVDELMQSKQQTYLFVLGWHDRFLWPAKQADKSTKFNFERWSPRFNELFSKWVTEFRDHVAKKGLPPERWAFYIMDEPPPGENRQEVINFCKEIKKVDPKLRTYITFPVNQGTEAENLELSKHIDTAQIIGELEPQVMKQIKSNIKHPWSYRILLRGASPFAGYRKGACWQPMKDGYTGTGFYVWDSKSGQFLWRDAGLDSLFAAVYTDHDNTVIPSLRAEAFREGIEDWKYVIMLDEAIAAAKKKGVNAAAVSAASAYRAKLFSELTDEESAYKFRDTCRSHLLALHEALGDVKPEQVKAVEE